MRHTASTQGEQPYLQIARALEERIRDEQPGYRPGDRLPSIAELREGRAGIPEGEGRNAATIRRAYDSLVEAGLVTSTPTVGYWVRSYPKLRYILTETHDPDRLRALTGPQLDGWTKDVEAAGYLGHQEIKVRSVLGREAIDDEYTVGELLQIGESDVAVVRDRLRSIATNPAEPRYEPESISRSYYPLALVDGGPLMESEGVNTAKWLADRGHPQVDFLHESIARPPTRDEARILRMPRGSAVMERITTARDPQGTPVYVQHVITAGNGSRFVTRIRYTHTGDE